MSEIENQDDIQKHPDDPPPHSMDQTEKIAPEDKVAQSLSAMDDFEEIIDESLNINADQKIEQWKQITHLAGKMITPESLQSLEKKFIQMSPEQAEHTLRLYQKFNGTLASITKGMSPDQTELIKNLSQQYPQLLIPSIFGFSSAAEFDAVKNITDPEVQNILAEIKNISDINQAKYTPPEKAIGPLAPTDQPVGPRPPADQPLGPRAEIGPQAPKNQPVGPRESEIIKTTEQAYLIEMEKKWGDNLIIEDFNEPSVKKQLEQLNKLPPEMINLLVSQDIKIKIGHKTISELCGYDLNPNIYGIYYPTEKLLYSSTLADDFDPPITSSVILHEVGHALDFISMSIPDKVKMEAHKRFYNKLGYHIKQEKPGDWTGSYELAADSMADYFNYSKEEFILRYDTDWYEQIDQAINTQFSNSTAKQKAVNQLAQEARIASWMIGEFMPEKLTKQ